MAARLSRLSNTNINISSNEPLVIISSSETDAIWSDHLKRHLRARAKRLEIWNLGETIRAEHIALGDRTTVAVALVSGAYLSSPWTMAEIRVLADLNDRKKLPVLTVVLDDCPWEQFEFVNKVSIWNEGKPLGNIDDPSTSEKLDRITSRVLELVGSNNEEQTDPSGEFYFSAGAADVLRGASELALQSKRSWITSSCLLFAFALASELKTTAFIYDALNGRGHYSKEFETFLKDGGPSAGNPVKLPGVSGEVSRNAAKILRRAAAIAINVSNTRQIHPRHLFAALISDVVTPSITHRLYRLDVELSALRRDFRRHIREVASHESAVAWDRILSEPRATSKSREPDVPPTSKTQFESVERQQILAVLEMTDWNKARTAEILGISRSTLHRRLLDYNIVRTRTFRGPEDADESLADVDADISEQMKNVGSSPKIQARLEMLEEQRRAIQTGSEVRPYKRSYSAFVPDRASYGPRITSAPLDDSLGVRTYAQHLAQLIAAKDTFMPLSIGLFGAWGSGKSHFIDLLDEQLSDLTKEPGKAFHKNIIKIHFNAWHYLDTNLWANLVSEIFDQLFDALKGPEDEETEQLKNLKNRLADQSALAAEAKVALSMAENVRKEAEDSLRSAMQARAKEELKVSTLLDDLKNLVITAEVKDQLRQVAKGLGLPKIESSFAELEARAEEVRWLGGRTKALLLAVFTGPGWWQRSLLLVVALAAPLAVSWLAVNGGSFFEGLLAGAGRTIAQVVTAIAALSTWLATQVNSGNRLVTKLETAYDKVKAVRAAREATDDAARAQAELAQKKQAEEEARHTLHEAEERLKSIRAELAEMAPGRQLFRFLRERATAEDYRRHLGLVSLVRRDFEQLSKLLLNVSEEGGELPKIDRIVLYIDDLDRCRADRVIEVLEAVHLLLAFPLFAVVVAVDPRWLRQSLLDHYPRLLGGADDELARRSVGRPATPQDYLEKIFQVPFNLHAMEKSGFESLVKHLFAVDGQRDQIEDTDVETTPSFASEEVSLPEDLLDDTSNIDSEILEPASVTVSPEPIDHRPIEPPLPPPDPERLVLTQHEVDDVQRFQLLFQTPRAVKRLANTYSLIRVGVDQDEWRNYLGVDGESGTYRIPLFLLAVSSAFPSLARAWLLWLAETPPTRWQLENDNVDTLSTRHADTTDRIDWEKLQHCLNRLELEGWPPPTHESLNRWLPRVARYSF